MRILCATDLLTKSDAAIERAGILSDHLNADLTLLHVVVPDESQQALEQALLAASAELQRRVRPPRWRSPDLLVMGTRGGSRLRRALAGSVANRVLHEASCDVLIVPEGSIGATRSKLKFGGRRSPRDLEEARREAAN